MKKIVLFILVALTIVSCTDAGTVEKIDNGNSSKYNIERYYYKNGQSIIIAERKNDPNLRTVTYTTKSGKNNVTHTNLIDDGVQKDGTYVFNKNQVLLENDSIIIIRK